MNKRQGATKARSRRLGTIDLDSGEVFDNGVPVWVNAKVRWGEDWFMGFQRAFAEISEDREMTLEVHRVWNALLGCLGFENFIAVEQNDLAERLGMRKQNVSRAIKKQWTRK